MSLLDLLIEAKEKNIPYHELRKMGDNARLMWRRGMVYAKAARQAGVPFTPDDRETAKKIWVSASAKTKSLPGLVDKLQSQAKKAFGTEVRKWKDETLSPEKTSLLRDTARKLRKTGEKATLKNLKKHLPDKSKDQLKNVQSFFRKTGFTTKSGTISAKWKSKQKNESMTPIAQILIEGRLLGESLQDLLERTLGDTLKSVSQDAVSRAKVLSAAARKARKAGGRLRGEVMKALTPSERYTKHWKNRAGVSKEVSKSTKKEFKGSLPSSKKKFSSDSPTWQPGKHKGPDYGGVMGGEKTKVQKGSTPTGKDSGEKTKVDRKLRVVSSDSYRPSGSDERTRVDKVIPIHPVRNLKKRAVNEEDLEELFGGYQGAPSYGYGHPSGFSAYGNWGRHPGSNPPEKQKKPLSKKAMVGISAGTTLATLGAAHLLKNMSKKK